ncbi:integrase [Lentibacillus lipolyticus]|nr:integrase [Lentibacillus lipolyticus]
MKTNEEMFQDFMSDNDARFSPKTKRSYRLSFNQFFSFTDLHYGKVKALHIRAWLSELREQGMKQRTIRLKLATLKSFYRYCLEENQVKKDPTLTVSSPKIGDSLPYYLDKRQLAELKEYLKDNTRERAMIEMMYTTGVRISELLNIRMEDIKWQSKQIWIRKGKGKKQRFALFNTECAARVTDYLNERDIESDYVFVNPQGRPLSRVYIEQIFRGYSEKLGFRVTPHTLRHTFAAHLAEEGMPQSYIQELLGHVNINTTRIYTRLNEKARKKQYDQYQP